MMSVKHLARSWVHIQYVVAAVIISASVGSPPTAEGLVPSAYLLLRAYGNNLPYLLQIACVLGFFLQACCLQGHRVLFLELHLRLSVPVWYHPVNLMDQPVPKRSWMNVTFYLVLRRAAETTCSCMFSGIVTFFPDETFVWSCDCYVSGPSGSPCIHCDMLMEWLFVSRCWVYSGGQNRHWCLTELGKKWDTDITHIDTAETNTYKFNNYHEGSKMRKKNWESHLDWGSVLYF